MTRDEEILDLIELLLTAEVYNQYSNLNVNDLTPVAREVYGIHSMDGERTPVVVAESALQRVLGIPDAHLRLDKHPLTLYEEFGHRLRITSLPAGLTWFLKNGGRARDRENPALAWFAREQDPHSVSHMKRSGTETPGLRTAGSIWIGGSPGCLPRMTTQIRS